MPEVVMKKDVLNHFGIIGDVHAEDKFLQIALDRLFSQNVRTILCTGDICDGSGDANLCCDILKRRRVDTVSGNHDRWALEQEMRSLPETTRDLSLDSMEYLKSLPKTREYSSNFGRILLCHGINQNDMVKINPDDYGYALEANSDLQDLIQKNEYSIVINGHSHKRMVRKINQIVIINSGTLYRNHNPCFVEVDLKKNVITFYLLDSLGNVVNEEKSEIL